MITRLALSDFRNHRDTLLAPGPGFNLLTGPNGAGKTNVLEAISLLSPGRGLRRAALRTMARGGGAGGFAIAARLGDGSEVGVGTQPNAPDRRMVRINGANAAASALAERLAILWLTPAMDRLFLEGAAGRRAFLDRLTLALEPDHARNASLYEQAMRERNRLLAEELHPDPAWLEGLELRMAEAGHALHDARMRTVAALDGAGAGDDDFPAARLALERFEGGDLAAALARGRRRDMAAGRTLAGPHRVDLAVTYAAKGQPAADCSTGEQKALLLGIVLAHADTVRAARGLDPVLLLDEVAAHLDPARREALYRRLGGRGQVFMTGTEPALFAAVGEAARFDVHAGAIERASPA
ncbi:DNA replication/repair protein RecF [Sphingomicrobium astaxanthinifaciens]|uniref:DNA replication/repair protein RecF n=1 Tax=Sphingomicrobium astaxanthinifaciens TaxID=1227949 RepID=UPI001FCB401B|nr:DNA replication/repair protein RecF [Sphingomicrobium astaxanthinifaciens]MCJ7421120.1 DNA replication/repair protein RecF [Sphingomicrobium astaxanthinifaciens]